MQNSLSKLINYINIKFGVIILFLCGRRKLYTILFILGYALFYFLIDFPTQSLVAHDEGLYARRSRLVEESSNWFDPPFDSPHHKTLGSYWFIALSIRFLGNSEFALRFPSIFSSFICLFLCYLITSIISNQRSALIAIFSLSSTPLWIKYSRYASPDIPFVLCILLIIFFFLKFINSSITINKYLYIFITGLFISSAFFIRSYMVFVPLLGLSPFLIFHLFKSRHVFKIIFFSGIMVGAIPTFLNLYFSYQRFGINGLTTLFEFVKKQAIGNHHLYKFILIPLNSLYLTFPIGFLLIILFIFTRSKTNILYPLLVYYYPLISLIILLSMSKTYPHYFLYLLPSLSILFSVYLESYSFRFFASTKYIKFLLLLLMILISCFLVSLPLLFNDLLIDFSYRQTLLVYIVSLFLVLSYINASRYLFKRNNNLLDLTKFFYNIVIPQYISISLLYNFGIFGNPNPDTKLFLNDSSISSILNYNTIYLYNLDSKIQTLLSYYLPSTKVVKSLDNINISNYIITSDIGILKSFDDKYVFKPVGKFDKNYLLMYIGK